MWIIVQHPEAGAGVISENALQSHQARGWSPVGEPHEDPEALRALLEDPPAPSAEPAPADAASTDVAAAPAAPSRTKER